jgi:hypothetical protein
VYSKELKSEKKEGRKDLEGDFFRRDGGERKVK